MKILLGDAAFPKEFDCDCRLFTKLLKDPREMLRFVTSLQERRIPAETDPHSRLGVVNSRTHTRHGHSHLHTHILRSYIYHIFASDNAITFEKMKAIYFKGKEKNEIKQKIHVRYGWSRIKRKN